MSRPLMGDRDRKVIEAELADHQEDLDAEAAEWAAMDEELYASALEDADHAVDRRIAISGDLENQAQQDIYHIVVGQHDFDPLNT